MPFRDREWEDFQRDCAMFPAYTDYIFGPDTRLNVVTELGLHPMIFGHSNPEPIRYTNSRPSCSVSYENILSSARYNSTMPNTPYAGKVAGSAQLHRQGYSGSEAPCGVDSYLTTQGPLFEFVAPQPVYAQDMAQRLKLNASQHRAAVNVLQAPAPVPQPLNFPHEQGQTTCGQDPLAGVASSQATPQLLHSSSATEVDEHASNQYRNNLPSPPESPVPGPTAAPTSIMQTNNLAPILSSENSLSSGAQWQSDGSRTYPPGGIIRPGDLLNNPYYSFVPHSQRSTMNAQIAEYWALASQAPSQHVRESALQQLKGVALLLGERRQKLQRDMMQQAAVSWQAHDQGDEIRIPHTPSPVQFAVLPSQVPASPAQFASRPPPAQRPPYLQAPDPFTGSPYQNPLAQPHRILPDHVRTSINAHLPQVWQFLQQLLGPFRRQGDHYHIQQWLTTFKNSLSIEGKHYMEQMLAKMWHAGSEGRDPLAEIEG